MFQMDQFPKLNTPSTTKAQQWMKMIRPADDHHQPKQFKKSGDFEHEKGSKWNVQQQEGVN